MRKNKISFFTILCFSILSFYLHVAVSAELPLILKSENNEIICLGKKNTDFVNCNMVLNSNATDTKTKKIRRISDEIIPIFSQASDAGYYFLIVARIPSKLPQGPGYCGAGYEDHMILLEYNRKRIRLLDDFLLQSCLTAIALAGDKSDDFLESISVYRKNHLVKFKWIGNPDDDDHVLKISEGKLLIN